MPTTTTTSSSIIGRIIDIYYDGNPDTTADCFSTGVVGEIVLFLRTAGTAGAAGAAGQAVRVRYAWPSYMYVRADSLRGRGLPPAVAKLVLRTETVVAKGFDDGFQDKPSKFLRIVCRNQAQLFAVRRGLRNCPVYEADIDPCVRFIHDHDLNPSGVVEVTVVASRAGGEVRGVVGAIRNRPDIQVPVLIASFDIECASHTGDFPLAQKSFRAFADALLDFCKRRDIDTIARFRTLMTVLQHPSYAPLALRGRGGPDPEYNASTVEPAIDHTLRRFARFTREGLRDVAALIVNSDLPAVDFPMPRLARPLTPSEVDELWTTHTVTSPPAVEGDPVRQIGTVLQWSDAAHPHEKVMFTVGSISGFDDAALVDLERARSNSPETFCEPTAAATVRIFSFRTDYEAVESVIDAVACELGRHRDETAAQCRAYARAHITDRLTSLLGPGGAARVLEELGSGVQSKKSAVSAVDLILEIANRTAPLNVTCCWGGERDMLLAWRNFVNVRDPDIVTGYNIFSFDYKYLFDRADELGVQTLGRMSRIPGFQRDLTPTTLSSSALGHNEMWIPAMPGRVAIDMYKFVQKEYALESYKLDDVALHFLGQRKADLPPQEIFRRQDGSDDDRRDVAMYCVIDCVLPVQLLRRLDVLQKNWSMSHVCRVPLSYLFVRGQGVKVYSLVVHYAHTVFPDDLILVNTRSRDTADAADTSADGGGGKYKGAIVFDPVCGLHLTPTAVGDFNSLYPSSMIARNVSHDMILDRGPWCGREEELRAAGYSTYTVEYTLDDDTVRECTFVQANERCRAGLLPEILKTLLQARRDVREQMKHEKDAFHRNVLDTLQLAYKITANSLYGQTGATTSRICRREIAACTTAIGRGMLLTARRVFEGLAGQVLEIPDRHDPAMRRKVYVGAAETRAGDTDSCMTSWACQWVTGPRDLAPIDDENDKVWVSMQVCKIACDRVNEVVPPPEHIAFEKVIYPFAIFAKKRYHGHYYLEDAFRADPDHPVFVTKSMGIVLKRRDNAPILKDIYGRCMDELMAKQPPTEVLRRVRDELLHLDAHPMSDFVITKTLRNDYKRPGSIAHKVLADRQAERDPGNRFESNDRVPFVYFRSPAHTKHSLQGERIETPAFVTAHGLELDYAFYIHHQLAKPLAQIFVDMLGMTDDFTRVIAEAAAHYEGGV